MHSRSMREGLAALFALFLPAASAALPILSEVFYDAEGSDDGHVFVELAGSPGTPLDGLWLEGVNGFDGSVTVHLELSGSIGPSGLFVVADRTGGGTSFVPAADQFANFDFQNGPDSVVLGGASGVLDALGYGSFGVAEFFAGEGAPAQDVPGGSSLARLYADLDSDDNASDFALALPSPGSAPLWALPEPGSAALLALGLALLGRSRRSNRGRCRLFNSRTRSGSRPATPLSPRRCA